MMAASRIGFAFAGLGCMVLAMAGCHPPGKPGPQPEIARPEQVLDFAALYKQNCAACHGESGHHGISVSLSNPVYLAVAGKDVLVSATAKGGPGELMPAFARSHGGPLTDQQIEILADGMERNWAHPDALAGQTPPAYTTTLKGDPAAGQAAFATYCARCHRASGAAAPTNTDGTTKDAGPLTNPSYLALISDQALRTMILAGKPDEGMPDWRGFGPRPLTDQQVTDIVAWLATQRQTVPANRMQSIPSGNGSAPSPPGGAPTFAAPPSGKGEVR
jgi:cytochrome c oxidase cbb3-type subunit 3/ubiquinol-cytochrome c reductase cytochrome c subunit